MPRTPGAQASPAPTRRARKGATAAPTDTPPAKQTRKPAKKRPYAKPGTTIAVPAELVTLPAGDWPTALDPDTALTLFKALRNGETLTKAAVGVGLEPDCVRQWKHRHAKFAAAVEEARTIGRDAALDDIEEIALVAKDRDTAAGAKVRIEARLRRLAIEEGARFNTSPFKPGALGGGGAVLGVILVPLKTTQDPASVPAIEGTAVRVPTKQGSPA